jgi:cytochrome oxidase assembly protein ShyY1
VLRIALRPRWLLALLLALGFAAGFVLLSQWQLSRSVEQATVVTRETETVVALDSVASPQAGVTTTAAGQLVSASIAFEAGDFGALSGRTNDGREGYWLVGHGVTAEGVSLAVALGWAPSAEQARNAAPSSTAPAAVEGRYEATEPAADDDFESGERSAMSVATLINEWSVAPAAVYGGYLILGEAPDGLETIDAPAPSDEVVLNWLNVFYAVEWVVFAGFAVFLWWRFVRDAWEREHEDADLN